MEQATKEWPLLAAPHEVRAILAGRKTQHRLVVTHPITPMDELGDEDYDGPTQYFIDSSGQLRTPARYGSWAVKCPHGSDGDLLWVQESWQHYFFGGGGANAAGVRYAADNTMLHRSEASQFTDKEWRLADSMPRWASRLLLQVVGVRLEKLINISTADAIAEGIEPVLCPTRGTVPAKKWKNYLGRAYQSGMNLNYATESYLSLWNSLHGPDAHLENPWVWVVEFKVIEPAAAAPLHTKEGSGGQTSGAQS
jgi:hypothetical protein